MKIAIIEDSGCISPEYFWCKTWALLCDNNNIPYEVFDSWKENFIRGVIDYQPDIILWRSGQIFKNTEKDVIKKDMWQRWVLEKNVGKKIVPDWNVHNLYENKILQTYLFQIQQIPHPETHIFFDYQDADIFLKSVIYPLVIKANAGAGSKSMRFCNNYDEAKKQLDENFNEGLVYFHKFREKNIFYAQEYVPAPGIWRIVMIGDDIGYSFYQNNRPGTKIASSQGFDSYPPTPVELLDLSAKINREMGWQYMMYDYIWKEATKEWLILETTDTCGPGHSAKRKITHYYTGDKWEDREDNTSPQELIFNKYVLGGTK